MPLHMTTASMAEYPNSNLTISFLLLLMALLAYLYKSSVRSSKQSSLNLPPQPRALPVIGHLHHLGKLPHRTLHLLSITHGPLMYLRLGNSPTIVVSSTEAAMDVLKVHDLTFCNRSPLNANKMFSYGLLDIAFSPFGEHWKNMRRIATHEVFNLGKVRSFERIREDEVRNLVEFTYNNEEVVNVSELGLRFFNNITCREAFGRRRSADANESLKAKFYELVVEAMRLMSGFSLDDFYPNMGWMSVVTGKESRLRRCFHLMDELFEEEFRFYGDIESRDEVEEEPSFMRTLLHLQRDASLGFTLTKEHIKALLMDILLGGIDTSAATVEWAMSELVNNPASMKKVQAEIRELVGGKKMVQEHDIEHLPYLKMVIKETLRLHPPIPFLVPRESREHCKLYGYDIPVKTRVLVNVWGIGRDLNKWIEPERFYPERFEENNVDYKGQDFEFLPFGGGRRMCPGMALGMAAVEVALANLLRSFDWAYEDGELGMVDMEEEFGLTTHRRNPLVLHCYICG